jgi:sulfatase maturation enzyme AslB (radical SAM superfamily)
MSTQEWFAVLRDAASVGCRQVQFIGGEPTLHPDLPDLISFAVNSKYTFIEVFTNATVLSNTLFARIKQHRVQVATSFYSDQASVHDSITGHSGSFDRTVRNIRKLIQDGIPLRVGIIETVANVGHADRAKSLLKTLGVSDISIDVERQVGRGNRSVKIQDQFSELCGDCSNGKLCVTASGTIFPCVFSRSTDLGSVNKGILNALNSTALAEFRSGMDRYKQRVDQQALVRASTTTVSDRDCGPDVICSPDKQCSPNCLPGSSKCMPSLSPCNPDTRCMPTWRYLPA